MVLFIWLIAPLFIWLGAIIWMEGGENVPG
jgi:hypothetical protein